MYGWAFTINDGVTKPLQAIGAGLQATTVQANSVTDALLKVSTKTGVGIDDLTKKYELLRAKGVQVSAMDMEQLAGGLQVSKAEAVGVSERIGNIATAALDLQRGFEYLSYPIQALPERFDAVKSSITDTLVAINSGDWSTAVSAITGGMDAAMGAVNNFRTSWQFVKEGFTGAKTIFSETWALFSQNGLQAIQTVKTLGLTFVTQTLPQMLTFVGQGVISMAGYVASLLGAESAQIALNVAMTANPIGVIVVGIAAVGAAVVGLIYYWDTVKSWLVDFGTFMVKNNPFSWIWDLIGNVFPNFKAAVVETFQSVFGWIDTYFIQPISAVMGWLGEQIDGVVADVNSATAAIVAPVEKTFSLKYDIQNGLGTAFNPFISNGEATPSVLTPEAIGAKKTKPVNLGLKDKTTDVKGGGGQIKNINQTIGKLVEKIEINVNKASEVDLRKLKDDVLKALLDVSNDFNYQ